VTPLGYGLHVRHTFRARPSWRDFWNFIGGSLLGAALSFAIIALMCSGLGQPAFIASPVSTVVVFAWNYAMTHWAIRAPRAAKA
jgi:putative flippase GtrA